MKPIKFIDFQSEVKQHKNEFKKIFDKVLSSGNYVLNKEVKNFEQKFAQYLKVNYCIGVANGLEALQIALLTLGIGKGDEVITTPVSAVATTLAIMATGAKPIFVDTNEYGLMNADLIPQFITKNTKAILPVHLYGNSVNLKKIKNICKKYKLYLIEDACQAHGSTYEDKKLGTLGDIGCFSFYPTKNLGCFGDGGAIVTNNVNIAKICYEIRDYGQSSKYHHTRMGLNSRLDELQAAFLTTKLSFLDEKNQKRISIANNYVKNLKHPALKIITPFITNSNFHLFVIRTTRRNDLQAFLSQKQIPSSIHYPLIIPDQPFFKKSIYNLDVSRKFVQEILSIPCHPYLELEQVDFISSSIMKFLKE